MSSGGNDAVNFSHDELIEITQKTLRSLIESDSLLSDLPKDVTLEEVTSQLALQHGQSMTVYVVKRNKEQMPIVVHLGATVVELKRAIRRYVSLQIKRHHGDFTKISWRYVWKTNDLVFGTQLLDDNNAKLADYGIANRSKLSFVKKLREKNKMKKS